MANLRKLFEIDDYDLQEEKIKVTIAKGDQFKNVSFSRARFERWMLKTGRLDYCNDRANCFGEHIQETGTLDIEDYWYDINIDKKKDLYEYIILKVADPDKIFDIKKPLSNILGGHFFTALEGAIK